MRSRKLKLKKEIVANLSNAENNQIRGGKATFEPFGGCVTELEGCSMTDIGMCCSNNGCPSQRCDLQTQYAGTSCCGDTYANCSECEVCMG